MKVDTMRKIDFLAGVPLCFFITPLVKLAQIFQDPRKKQPKNILLIELSEMGSTILVDPAMQKLKNKLDANLFFVIFKKNAPSLQLLNTIPKENIFTIREDGLVSLMTSTLSFLLWARKNKIDSVIDLELFSRFTALLTGLCGAQNRVGYYRFHNEGLYRGEMLTHKVAYNSHIHIAKNFIALANALITSNEEVPYSKTLISDEEVSLQKVSYSDDQKSSMRAKITAEYKEFDANKHRIVLINPNASELLIQRRWMPEYYITLMKMILEKYDDTLILITGAPNEYEEAAGLVKAVTSNIAPKRIINFAGKLKLHELPILYSVSTLMVTNDSGPGHFSSITELPTYVIFGPETPKLYGSLGNSTPIYAGLACSPCVSASNHRKTPCEDNVCLQVIKPDYVFKTIKNTLG
jgi:ADP-heptose:LPS heptosyltransferase